MDWYVQGLMDSGSDHLTAGIAVCCGQFFGFLVWGCKRCDRESLSRGRGQSVTSALM